MMGLVAFLAAGVLVMYGTGYFNPKVAEFTGLKFTTSSSVIITENEGIKYLCLVGKDATEKLDKDGKIVYNTHGDPIFEDETESKEITLVVRNKEGLIDNSIITVPRTVRLGEYFEIQAKLNTEDNSNVGGVCYIYATAENETFRVKAPLEIKVDVPVSSITLQASNYASGEALSQIGGVITKGFVFNDQIQFDTVVTPSRARYIFNDPTLLKELNYYSSNTENVSLDDSKSGVATVEYKSYVFTDETITTPSKTTTIEARINKFGASNTEVCSSQLKVNLFPVQLDQLQIGNTDYVTGPTTTLWYRGKSLMLCAMDLFKLCKQEDKAKFRDVVNLDISFKAKNSESIDILDELITTNFVIMLAEGSSSALELKEETYEGNDVRIPYWVLEAKRMDKIGENLAINFCVLDSNRDIVESKTVSHKIDISAKLPDEFYFVDENNNRITRTDLEITKEGTNISTQAIYQLRYRADVESDTTFSKFVFFLDEEYYYGRDNLTNPDNAGIANKNKTNSNIIDVTDRNELSYLQGAPNALTNDYIHAMGAGTARIIPYVVKTNDDGEPVDCEGNVINKGFSNGLISYEREAYATAGQYIYYRVYSDSKFIIKIQEKITSIAVYTDIEFTDPVVSSKKMTIGTGKGNQQVFYAKANSPLALPSSFSEGQQKNIKIEFKENGSYFQKPNLAEADMSTAEFIDKNNNGVIYDRYLKFGLYADNEADGIVTLCVYPNESDKILHYDKEIKLRAIDVKVESVGMDILEEQSSFLGNGQDGLIHWNLDITASDTVYVQYLSEQSFVSNVRIRFANNVPQNIINAYQDEDLTTMKLPDASYTPVKQMIVYNSSNNQDPEVINTQNFVVNNVKKDIDFFVLNETEYNALVTAKDDVSVSDVNAILTTDKAEAAKSYASSCTIRLKTTNYMSIQFKKPIADDEYIIMTYRPKYASNEVDRTIMPCIVVFDNYIWPEAVFDEASTTSDPTEDNGDVYYPLSMADDEARYAFAVYKTNHNKYNNTQIRKGSTTYVECGCQITTAYNTTVLSETPNPNYDYIKTIAKGGGAAIGDVANWEILKSVRYILNVDITDGLWELITQVPPSSQLDDYYPITQYIQDYFASTTSSTSARDFLSAYYDVLNRQFVKFKIVE